METIAHKKIILADDHILLRDALAEFIDKSKQFTVVAKAANGKEVIDMLDSGWQTDILLMDLNMPKMDGYDTASQVAEKYPEIKTVILTMHDNELTLIRLLHLGISGFLKKDIHPDELIEALETVSAGEYYYCSQAIGKIASHYRKHRAGDPVLEKPFFNEQDIRFIKLACTGLTYREIAMEMQLSIKYMDNYRVKLFEKLGIISRVELVVYAIRNGIYIV